MSEPVLEPAAEAIADPPHLFELPPADTRKAVDAVQSPAVEVQGTEKKTLIIPGGPTGSVSVTIFRPSEVAGPLPVVFYIHGAGWVFGNDHTHDRLAHELAVRVGAAVVFPNYRHSPQAGYPIAVQENYAATQWVVTHGATHGLDPARLAVAGDSVGANMAIALTLTAKQHGDVPLAGQVLFYPATDGSFDIGSDRQFAERYFLRRDAMQVHWNQYTTNAAQRAEINASPPRAAAEQLAGLPPALIIVAEADVLLDEAEAYADRLRQAGVPVTAVRHQGVDHDFLMLNALREIRAAEAAIRQAADFLSTVLLTR